MRVAIGVVAAMALAVAVAAVAQVKLTEDPPVVAQPRAGDIVGVITPAAKIASLKAVSRVTGETYMPASLDKTTGKFTFKAMPGDACYDLSVQTPDGRTVEGIDLSFDEERMLRLADQRRKDMGLPAAPLRPFTAADVQWFRDDVAKMDDFFDIQRMIYLRAKGGNVTLLVERLRTREFVAQKGGELVWRVELWYFQWNHGGWQRVANSERNLYRQRTAASQWKQTDVEFYPELSACIDAKGAAKAVEFAIPDAPDPSRGRVKGTDPAIKTEPHVLGLEPTKTPATQEE